MSLPQTTTGYALGPDDGEAMWFNGGLGILKATAEQTEGRFTAYELRIPKGFAAPLHSHKNEDEFFLVLAGEVRLQHGDEVLEAVPGRSRSPPAASVTRSTSTPMRPSFFSSSDQQGSRDSSGR
jgi:Cupin domain